MTSADISGREHLERVRNILHLFFLKTTSERRVVSHLFTLAPVEEKLLHRMRLHVSLVDYARAIVNLRFGISMAFLVVCFRRVNSQGIILVALEEDDCQEYKSSDSKMLRHQATRSNIHT